MKLLLLAAVASMRPAPVGSCGLDIFGVCGGAHEAEEALKDLPEKAREAAQKVLDHLFRGLLPPAVDKITAAAKQLEDRAEKDYEKAINATRQQLEELAERVVELAEEFARSATADVEEIVDHVEKDVLGLTQQVISDVDRRVNAMLSRLENDGKEMFCAAQGYLDVLEMQFSSYFQKQDCECVMEMLKTNPGLAQDCACTSCFRLAGFYPGCQCNPWGLRFGPGWYNQGKFDFLKCHLEKAIDWEHWTVDQIVKQLSIVQEAALSFRCLEDLNPGSTLSREYFTNQYTNITHIILVWTTGAIRLRKAEQAEQPGIHAPVGADNPCQGMTIQECLTRTMSQVEEARDDYDNGVRKVNEELEKAKADYDSGMRKVNEELEKAKADFDSDVRKVNETVNRKADSSQVDALGKKVAAAHLSSECWQRSTPVSNNGKGEDWQLIHHNVKCADGEDLQQWHLVDPVPGYIQVNFTCCKSHVVMQNQSVLLV